jgi:tryptophan synthase alpha chain
MNELTKLISRKQEKLLSVFFTAGYPRLDSTGKIILSLQENHIDFIEVGMPYSDPLADGPVIQQTNTVAIHNGMTLDVLFSQLEQVKSQLRIPAILMGYLNPVLQYGMEAFCERAATAGVSGVILPDLPLQEFQDQYAGIFQKFGLHCIFLVTPTTSEKRVREIDRLSTAFIYAVSASSTTGRQDSGQSSANETRASVSDHQRQDKLNYLERLKNMKLSHPVVVGFGINDRETLADAWKYGAGAIIGTAYLKLFGPEKDEQDVIKALLKQVQQA